MTVQEKVRAQNKAILAPIIAEIVNSTMWQDADADPGFGDPSEIDPTYEEMWGREP